MQATMQNRILFIGAGNMATSLIGGLIANGTPAEAVCAADPNEEQLRKVAEQFGIRTTTDNSRAVDEADTVVLAVKPQVMADVAKAIGAPASNKSPLVISVAAGIREPDLRRWLGYDAAIVRTMPNTPALVQCGATALFGNEFVDDTARSMAEALMAAVGICEWVDSEELLDAVTAVSGSGPAYCFLLMELMTESGKKMGLSESLAMRLSQQTMLGAATMACQSPDSPSTLRQKVTSPGGTTERALEIFGEGAIEDLVEKALKGAQLRAVELGELLGGE
jgi:pyrroline-5-carboxylate reductase